MVQICKFSLRLGTSLLFNLLLEALDSAVRQEKEIKSFTDQEGKNKTVSNDMIAYVENPKKQQKNVQLYKIIMLKKIQLIFKKSTAFHKHQNLKLKTKWSLQQHPKQKYL